MSRKHNQRSRAEILAKRAKPIQEVRVLRETRTPAGPILVPQPTHSEKLRAAFDASKYKPHFGKKQQAKLTPDCHWVSEQRLPLPSGAWIQEY